MVSCKIRVIAKKLISDTWVGMAIVLGSILYVAMIVWATTKFGDIAFWIGFSPCILCGIYAIYDIGRMSKELLSRMATGEQIREVKVGLDGGGFRFEII